MRLKFYLLGVLIILGANLNSKAQVSYNKRAIGNIGTVPSAGNFLNGASLDNVDMATGTLKVGIPLYEIKTNDISVPIVLNYSATGLKVGQEASSVGMGWELSAGGKIITNIQGKLDNSANGIKNNPLPDVTSLLPFTNSAHKTVVTNILEGKKDSGWDTYNYILPNSGGTFTENGLTFPYDPLITINSNQKITTTDGLVYNFDAGTKRKTSKRLFYSTNNTTTVYQPTSYDPDPVEWYDYDLRTICSSRFKDTVFFGYERFNTGVPGHRPILSAKKRTRTTETLPLYRNVSAASQVNGGVIFGPDDKKYNILEPIISQSTTEVTVHSRINEIVFPNGKILFAYYDDILGADALQTLTIYRKVDNSYILVKEYLFQYDSNKSYGHYLEAIHIYDSKRQLQNSWDFKYYEKLNRDPRFESKSQDKWGFFNGVDTNYTLLEHPDNVIALRNRNHYPIVDLLGFTSGQKIHYTRPEAIEIYGYHLGYRPDLNGPIFYSIPFADRSYNFASAVKGTLKSVRVPTGARYEYDYEPNRFSYDYYPGQDSYHSVFREYGGGIRIKSILRNRGNDASYYGSNSKEVYFAKKYVYGEGDYDHSGGSLDSSGIGDVTIPGNVLANRSVYYSSNPNDRPVVMNMMLLSHPINSLVQYGGSYALYQSVSEILMKGKTDAVGSYGKTIYYNKRIPYESTPDRKWRSASGVTLDNPYLPYFNNNPGVPNEEIVGYGNKKYAYNNSMYYPVEETIYSYQSFNAPENSTNKLVSFFGSLTGQMLGPFPASTGIVVDRPWPTYIGEFKFNGNQDMGENGYIDYITRMTILDENKTIDYNDKYATELLDLNRLSRCFRKSDEITWTRNDEGNLVMATKKQYYYGNPAHLLPTRISSFNSKMDEANKWIFYPQDYPSGSMLGVDAMKTSRIGLGESIQESNTYSRLNVQMVNYLTDEEIVSYTSDANGIPLPSVVSKYEIAHDLNGYTGRVDVPNGLVYKPQISYEGYIKGNLHKYTESKGPGNVIFWGYNNQYAIAKISNASNSTDGKSNDVAYTSFEGNETWTNWNYSSVGSLVTTPSGRKAYNLNAGSISKINSTKPGRYIISYWFKAGATVTITGATVGAAVIKNTWGDWQLAEREISGTINTVTVSGTGYIDELRFHPFDSQMVTYTYEPLVGLSGIIDHNGKAQFYEYDDSQRLKNIKDTKGNIIKSYKYIIGTENLNQ
nr:hypothetical protein [Pedobacter panaciterrae]